MTRAPDRYASGQMSGSLARSVTAVSGRSSRIAESVRRNETGPFAEMALTMSQMSRERLKALGDAALEYQRREFDRDLWLDHLESWLRELSEPSRAP